MNGPILFGGGTVSDGCQLGVPDFPRNCHLSLLPLPRRAVLGAALELRDPIGNPDRVHAVAPIPASFGLNRAADPIPWLLFGLARRSLRARCADALNRPPPV